MTSTGTCALAFSKADIPANQTTLDPKVNDPRYNPDVDFYFQCPPFRKYLFSAAQARSKGINYKPQTPQMDTVTGAIPDRDKRLWSNEKVWELAKGLRDVYTNEVMQITRGPETWEDLYDYFDGQDLFGMGAYNVWCLMNTLVDQNRILDPLVKADLKAEIEAFIDEWLDTEGAVDQLLAWEPVKDPTILVVLRDYPLADLGELTKQDILFLGTCLANRYDKLKAARDLGNGVASNLRRVPVAIDVMEPTMPLSAPPFAASFSTQGESGFQTRSATARTPSPVKTVGTMPVAKSGPTTPQNCNFFKAPVVVHSNGSRSAGKPFVANHQFSHQIPSFVPSTPTRSSRASQPGFQAQNMGRMNSLPAYQANSQLIKENPPVDKYSRANNFGVPHDLRQAQSEAAPLARHPSVPGMQAGPQPRPMHNQHSRSITQNMNMPMQMGPNMAQNHHQHNPSAVPTANGNRRNSNSPPSFRGWAARQRQDSMHGPTYYRNGSRRDSTTSYSGVGSQVSQSSNNGGTGVWMGSGNNGKMPKIICLNQMLPPGQSAVACPCTRCGMNSRTVCMQIPDVSLDQSHDEQLRELFGQCGSVESIYYFHPRFDQNTQQRVYIRFHSDNAPPQAVRQTDGLIYPWAQRPMNVYHPRWSRHHQGGGTPPRIRSTAHSHASPIGAPPQFQSSFASSMSSVGSEQHFQHRTGQSFQQGSPTHYVAHQPGQMPDQQGPPQFILVNGTTGPNGQHRDVSTRVPQMAVPAGVTAAPPSQYAHAKPPFNSVSDYSTGQRPAVVSSASGSEVSYHGPVAAVQRPDRAEYEGAPPVWHLRPAQPHPPMAAPGSMVTVPQPQSQPHMNGYYAPHQTSHPEAIVRLPPVRGRASTKSSQPKTAKSSPTRSNAKPKSNKPAPNPSPAHNVPVLTISTTGPSTTEGSFSTSDSTVILTPLSSAQSFGTNPGAMSESPTRQPVPAPGARTLDYGTVVHRPRKAPHRRVPSEWREEGKIRCEEKVEKPQESHVPASEPAVSVPAEDGGQHKAAVLDNGASKTIGDTKMENETKVDSKPHDFLAPPAPGFAHDNIGGQPNNNESKPANAEATSTEQTKKKKPKNKKKNKAAQAQQGAAFSDAEASSRTMSVTSGFSGRDSPELFKKPLPPRPKVVNQSTQKPVYSSGKLLASPTSPKETPALAIPKNRGNKLNAPQLARPVEPEANTSPFAAQKSEIDAQLHGHEASLTTGSPPPRIQTANVAHSRSGSTLPAGFDPYPRPPSRMHAVSRDIPDGNAKSDAKGEPLAVDDNKEKPTEAQSEKPASPAKSDKQPKVTVANESVGGNIEMPSSPPSMANRNLNPNATPFVSLSPIAAPRPLPMVPPPLPTQTKQADPAPDPVGKKNKKKSNKRSVFAQLLSTNPTKDATTAGFDCGNLLPGGNSIAKAAYKSQSVSMGKPPQHQHNGRKGHGRKRSTATTTTDSASTRGDDLAEQPPRKAKQQHQKPADGNSVDGGNGNMRPAAPPKTYAKGDKLDVSGGETLGKHRFNVIAQIKNLPVEVPAEAPPSVKKEATTPPSSRSVRDWPSLPSPGSAEKMAEVLTPRSSETESPKKNTVKN